MNDVVDLSRLEPPTIVHPLDWDHELATFIAQLKFDFPDLVGVFESDSFVKAARTWSYRLTLLQQSHNQDAQSILLAYAKAQDLDHIAATFYTLAGISRDEGEADKSFQERIQLSPEAYAGTGNLHGYAFQARKVDPIAIPYVDVEFPAPGYANVAIQTADDVDDDQAAELLDAVRARLHEDRHKTSDVLTVSRVERIDVTVRAVVHVAAGPDAGLVIAAAERDLDSLSALISRPRQALSMSALNDALHSPAAIRVVIYTPTEEIAPGFGQAVRFVGREITAEVVNG